VAGPWRPEFGGKPAAGTEIDRAGCALVAGLRAQRTDHGREQQRNSRYERDDEYPCATEFTHASHASAAPPTRLDGCRGSRSRNWGRSRAGCLCFWSRRMNGAAIALAGTLRQFINSLQLLADGVIE
jgi:hypothetical protein